LIEVASDVWLSIEAYALNDYPEECCGLLVEDGSGVSVLHKCENIQNKLHAKDPEGHPRMAKTAYHMDDLQVSKILRSTEDTDGKLVAIYHSHIDCDAYFSEEDQKAAQLFGEPAYPGVTYLVVSVIDRKVENRKAFSWSADSSQFEEVPLSVV